MSIAVLGILVLLASPILAIVLGVVSVRRIDRSAGQLSGRGLAVGAIFMGVLGLLAVVPVVLFIGFLGPHQADSASVGNVNVNINVPAVEVKNEEDDANAEVTPLEAPAPTAAPAPVAAPRATAPAGGSVSVQPKTPAKTGTAKKTEFEF